LAESRRAMPIDGGAALMRQHLAYSKTDLPRGLFGADLAANRLKWAAGNDKTSRPRKSSLGGE
jgi:hypothetical protein